MQPCPQPRYGLMERSNEISGESLRVMILRVVSIVTVVLNGGSSSKLCQPSSKAIRASGSERAGPFGCGAAGPQGAGGNSPAVRWTAVEPRPAGYLALLKTCPWMDRS